MTQPITDAQHRADSRSELLTVPEVCDALRISKWSLYRLINERRLRTVRIGARRLVTRDDLKLLLAELRAEGADDGR